MIYSYLRDYGSTPKVILNFAVWEDGMVVYNSDDEQNSVHYGILDQSQIDAIVAKIESQPVDTIQLYQPFDCGKTEWLEIRKYGQMRTFVFQCSKEEVKEVYLRQRAESNGAELLNTPFFDMMDSIEAVIPKEYPYIGQVTSDSVASKRYRRLMKGIREE